MDFLTLFNEVAKLAKPAVADEIVPITDKQVTFKDSGLDSLDLLMITVYMCEIFGISEEVGKNLKPMSVAEVETFVTQHATKTPASVEEALASVK